MEKTERIKKKEKMDRNEEIESIDPDKIFKILIVDDEKDVLNSLQLALKHAKEFKSEISIANNGETALTKMMDQSFDLVLADYKMPDMNGVELLTKINEKYPEIAKILITGYSDIDTAKDAINKAKVDNYIEKPCHKDELTATVMGALVRKNEKEIHTPAEVDNVKDALEVVLESKRKLMEKTKGSIPLPGAKQIIILEFSSSAEFNKFSFEIRKMKNVSIDDMQIFENKYIIKIGLFLESFSKII